VLTVDNTGELKCDNDDGGAAGTITGSGSVGRLPSYTGTGILGDSTLLQAGSTLQLDSGNGFELLGGDLSIDGGNANITGSVTASGAINANGGIVVGGGGSIAIAAKRLLILRHRPERFGWGVLRTNLGDSVDLTAEVTGILPVAYGGTGLDASTAANGKLLIGNGSGFVLGNITGSVGLPLQTALEA